MYQGCYRPGQEQLADRCCRPNMPEDIDVERTNYEIEESINSSINNKGFLVQLQIGALIIFDDVFSSAVTALTNNTDGNTFELRLDENGNLSINGNTLDISSSDGNKTVVIRNGKASIE